MSAVDRFIKKLASLKLAVFVILSIGVVSAVGTIYEAQYDAYYAQQVVYQSWYMYAVLGLLCTVLIAVMVDRWPWRPHHMGFIFAHIGIIITLIGAYVTQRIGVDGTMTFEMGQSNRFVQVNDRELSVYSTFDGNEIREMRRVPVNFLKDPPSAQEPFKLSFGSEQLEVFEYHHFADRKAEILGSERKGDGPALRFLLSNPNVNLLDWVQLSARRGFGEKDLGPAKVVLSDGTYVPNGSRNEIVLKAIDGSVLEYLVFNQRQGRITSKGKIREGEEVETGWMGLKFKLVRFLPHAYEKVEYTPRNSSSPLALSAAKIRFHGQEYWLGLNSILKVFVEDTMYMLIYANRRLDIGVQLRLKDFRIGRYQGTNRAATYESLVEVPEQGDHVISMNEPLKHNGYTFYQASFEENEKGEPTASVLSVNYDPGRPLKYFGSLLIVAGTILLFYFKKFGRRKEAAT